MNYCQFVRTHREWAVKRPRLNDCYANETSANDELN